MCGISGIYAPTILDKHHRLIDLIIHDQFKRGPDSQSKLVIKNKHGDVLFGHNRLAIIDLSNHGIQPMWNSTQRFCIVFNGEIYNYLELRTELKKLGFHFNTLTDTEVILNAFSAWGSEALNHFIGPFAFALFDQHRQELLLCRDRFGVRPLFYHISNNVLSFASTSNVLARELNLSPDLNYVAQGLTYLVYEDNSSRTAYQQLFSVPASCYIKIKYDSKGQLLKDIVPYYDLASNVQNMIESLPLNNMNNLIDKTLHTLENAVNVRLRADVPLAVSLSSGLDSSSIAALTSEQHPNIKGFSFSHPHAKKSEGPLVAKCAKFINIPIEYVWPNEKEMIYAFFKTIEVQDAPFPSLSVVAQQVLYQKVNEANIKVLLGGQGGDEAFMGYKKFLMFSLQQSIKNKHYLTVIKKIITLLPNIFAEIPALKSYWKHRYRYKKNYSIENNILNLPPSSHLFINHSTNQLWQRQLKDIQCFSLPTLMRYEDRNAMSNSVESRLPFMDHHLIELALALPEALKLQNGYGKWIIRKMMLNKIPSAISLARFKRGFDLPIKKLIDAGLGHSIRSVFRNNIALCNEFIKQPYDFNKHFSNAALLSHNRLHESIILLWLNKNCNQDSLKEVDFDFSSK